MPLEYVRVKDKSTGHHYSVLRQEAENDPDAYQVLKQDAVDANGNPLPGEIPGVEAPDEPGAYDAWKVGELRDEITRRNTDRDPAEHLSSAGNKPDLIAALAADDENKES